VAHALFACRVETFLDACLRIFRKLEGVETSLDTARTRACRHVLRDGAAPFNRQAKALQYGLNILL
jgi:hypothetical protein